MRVLLVCENMDCGGAETHVAELARGLSLRGVEVTLLSSGGAVAEALLREGIGHIRVNLRDRSPLGIARGLLLLRRYIQRGNFSLLHAHARYPALLLRLSSLGLGIPLAVTAHAHFRRGPILRRLSVFGDRTVAVSADIRRELIRAYGLPPDGVTVIPNGIDVHRFSPVEEKLRTPHSVCFVSRMDADCSRGAELLCAIAPRLARAFPAIRITLVGGGEAFAHVRALAERANRLVGREVVLAIGRVGDVAALLRGEEVAVAVSRAAMEAAASGCAVILCGNEGYLGILDSASAPLSLESNFCGRGAQKATAERLFADLVHLLSSERACRRAAEEGGAFVREHLSAESMCRQTHGFYQDLLSSACEKKAKKRLLVAGYFGCGNLGDDAILKGLLCALGELAPKVEAEVLSGSPRRDRRRLGLRTYGRKNPFAILVALLRADVLLLGGGSLLQSRTSRRSLGYYLGLLCFARLLGRPTVLLAAGLGPFCAERDVRAVRRALRRVTYLSLRDEGSRRFLLTGGVSPARVHRSADLALLLPKPESSSSASSPEKGRTLALLLRAAEEGGDPLRLSAEVAAFCRERGLRLLLLPLDVRRDLSLCRAAAKETGGELFVAFYPEELAARLSCVTACVTLRLHGLILASLAGLPALALSPDGEDGKLAAFAEAVGQEEMPLSAARGERLRDALSRLLARDGAFLAKLEGSVEREEKKARKDLAKLLEMLYNKRG